MAKGRSTGQAPKGARGAKTPQFLGSKSTPATKGKSSAQSLLTPGGPGTKAKTANKASKLINPAPRSGKSNKLPKSK